MSVCSFFNKQRKPHTVFNLFQKIKKSRPQTTFHLLPSRRPQTAKSPSPTPAFRKHNNQTIYRQTRQQSAKIRHAHPPSVIEIKDEQYDKGDER